MQIRVQRLAVLPACVLRGRGSRPAPLTLWQALWNERRRPAGPRRIQAGHHLFREKESPPVIRVRVVRFETYCFVIFVPRALNVAAMGKRNRQIDAREIVLRSKPDRFAES